MAIIITGIQVAFNEVTSKRFFAYYDDDKLGLHIIELLKKNSFKLNDNMELAGKTSFTPSMYKNTRYLKRDYNRLTYIDGIHPLLYELLDGQNNDLQYVYNVEAVMLHNVITID